MKSKEVVRTLVERIPEEVLRRITIRNKRVEHSRRKLSIWDQIKRLGSGRNEEEMARKKICPGSRKNGMMVRRRVRQPRQSLHNIG